MNTPGAESTLAQDNTKVLNHADETTVTRDASTLAQAITTTLSTDTSTKPGLAEHTFNSGSDDSYPYKIPGVRIVSTIVSQESRDHSVPVQDPVPAERGQSLPPPLPHSFAQKDREMLTARRLSQPADSKGTNTKTETDPDPISPTVSASGSLTNEQLVLALTSVPTTETPSHTTTTTTTTTATTTTTSAISITPTSPSINIASHKDTQDTFTNSNNNGDNPISIPIASSGPNTLNTSIPTATNDSDQIRPHGLGIDAESRREERVSPTEILGNALAAVARSNTSSTAFGNLAANLSNILSASSKFAAAVQRTQDGRRKSTTNAPNGSSGQKFTNMLDQAFLLTRPATIPPEESDSTTKTPGSISSSSSSSSPSLLNSKGLTLVKQLPHQQSPVEKKPELIIKNDQVWRAIEGVEEKSLGFHLYTPTLLLPNLEKWINGVLQVRIPAHYLSYSNPKVRKRAVWGTDIYTDDSDIVAIAIHSGKYQPRFNDPEVRPDDDPFSLAVAGKHVEAAQAVKKRQLSIKRDIISPSSFPDHDLKVTLKVLPKLRSYASSIRHRIKSRSWGANHDGMSLYVVKVEKIKRGEARLGGRSSLKAGLFAYEPYRKRALGLDTPKSTTIVPEDTKTKKRIKKTHKQTDGL
ncbi:histone deacetylation protein Rxt3-domain-containing protein [Phycomyces nitens]|nr:histone deacetylation protein Rxt3-domain-containing protein [Phycomyces nitens]